MIKAHFRKGYITITYIDCYGVLAAYH